MCRAMGTFWLLCIIALRHPVGRIPIGYIHLVYTAQKVKVIFIRGLLVSFFAHRVVYQHRHLFCHGYVFLEGFIIYYLAGPVAVPFLKFAPAVTAPEGILNLSLFLVHRRIPENNLAGAVGAYQHVRPQHVVNPALNRLSVYVSVCFSVPVGV